MEKIKKLENHIDYEFNDKKLIKQALATPQLGSELGIPHYEVLETLGDSVLKTALILKKYKEKANNPAEITKFKQVLESNEKYNYIAQKYFNLEDYLFKANQKIDGTLILADVLEAICGAIFLDTELNN